MKLRCTVLLVVSLGVVPEIRCLGAADDPDLPQPFDASVLQPLLKNSPFNRELDLSDTLVLTGIATVEGKPMATVLNRLTKKSYVVSDKPNAEGWRLAEASIGDNPLRSQIQMVVGPEVVTIRFSQASPIAPKNVPPNPNKLTEADVIRKDPDGKPYVRGSAYLSEADHDRYRNGMSREAHDKFREIMMSNREKMFAASPEERAAFAKRVFDKVDAEDRARGGK